MKKDKVTLLYIFLFIIFVFAVLNYVKDSFAQICLILMGLFFIISKSINEEDENYKNIEYGSASFSTNKNIQKYIDKNFYNNLILTKTERISLERNAKKHENTRNKNVMVVGSSGTGKTRSYILPNIAQLQSSMIISDTKSTTLKMTGKMLKKAKYKIKEFNLVDLSKSLKFNPFAYLETEIDILRFVSNFIENTSKKDAKQSEDIWTNSEKLYFTATIALIIELFAPHDRNFETLLDIINLNSTLATEDPNQVESSLKEAFETVGRNDSNSLAYRQYLKLIQAQGKTLASILISVAARMSIFDIKEIRELTRYDEIDVLSIAKEKTALFIIIDDVDSSLNFLSSILVNQLIQKLMKQADLEFNGYFDRPIMFLLDEFIKFGKIDNMADIISVNRSRNISISMIIQNTEQLKSLYKDDAKTLIANCDSLLFLGTTEKDQAKYFSEMLGKKTIKVKNNSYSSGSRNSYSESIQKISRELMTINEILEMKNNKCIYFLRGEKAFFSDKFDISFHPRYKYISENKSDYYNNNNFLEENNLLVEKETGNSEKVDRYFVDMDKIANIELYF